MTRPFLIINNTRAIDPTLPDLYAGIAEESLKTRSWPLFATVFAEKAQKAASKALGIAFWIAVGVVGAMVL